LALAAVWTISSAFTTRAGHSASIEAGSIAIDNDK